MKPLQLGGPGMSVLSSPEVVTVELSLPQTGLACFLSKAGLASEWMA